MFKFSKAYFSLAILLFIIEVLIALYVHDNFIRPYVGDVLVVVLIYCFLRSFWNTKYSIVAISVLIFAYCVEFLQYLKIVDILDLRENKVMATIIGTSFSFEDLIAYFFGFLIILVIEKYRKKPTEIQV
ncbi:MAG: DUF2809 domain-containing protein [Chloroflexia bacterium]|nr:DUF2809 domain-containing protein [Chloroflexia bacterium]